MSAASPMATQSRRSVYLRDRSELTPPQRRRARKKANRLERLSGGEDE